MRAAAWRYRRSRRAYRYPLAAAARVAVGTTADFLERLDEDASLVVIRFELFSDEALATFQRALDGWWTPTMDQAVPNSSTRGPRVASISSRVGPGDW